jgi:hypothetical protein
MIKLNNYIYRGIEMKEIIISYFKSAALRLLLNIFLIYKIYSEVKIWTFIFVCLVSLSIELEAITNKFKAARDKELFDYIDKLHNKLFNK